MAFRHRSLVEETTKSTGTGQSIVLEGSATGRFSFADQGYSAGDTCFYTLINGDSIEGGIGTFQGGTDFDRAATPEFSTNLGSRINLDGSEASVIVAPLGELMLMRDGTRRLYDGNGDRLSQLTPRDEQSSDFTAVFDSEYPVDTSSNTVIVTLPGSPRTGDRVRVRDSQRTASANPITVDGNGSTIDGDATRRISRDGGAFELFWSATDGEWHAIFATDVMLLNPVSEQSLDFAADVNSEYPVDVTANAVTVTLPGGPQDGDRIRIRDSQRNANNNLITVDGNGNTIDGEPSHTITRNGGMVEVVWNAADAEWHAVLATDAMVANTLRTGATRAISNNLALTDGNDYAQHIRADADKLVVSLPDATTLVNGPVFEIYNRGLTGYRFAIEDYDGDPVVFGPKGQQAAVCHLHDNTTPAGVWSVPNFRDLKADDELFITPKEVEAVFPDEDLSLGMLTDNVGIALWDNGDLVARAIDFATDPPTLLGSSAVTVDRGGEIGLNAAAPLDSSRVLFVYGSGFGAIVKWDGSSNILDTGQTTISSAGTGGVNVTTLGTDSHLCGYHDSGNSNLLAAHIDTSSGIAVSAADTVLASTTVEPNSGAAFDSTYAVWGYESSGAIVALVVKWDGTSISVPSTTSVASISANPIVAAAPNSTDAIFQVQTKSPNNMHFFGLTFDSASESLTTRGSITHTKLGDDDILGDPSLEAVTGTSHVYAVLSGANTNDSGSRFWMFSLSIVNSTITEIGRPFNGFPLSYSELRIGRAFVDKHRVPILSEDDDNSAFVTASRFDVSVLEI